MNEHQIKEFANRRALIFLCQNLQKMVWTLAGATADDIQAAVAEADTMLDNENLPSVAPEMSDMLMSEIHVAFKGIISGAVEMWETQQRSLSQNGPRT